MQQNIPQIVNSLLELQSNYSKTYRAMTSAEKYKGLVETSILKDWNYSTELIREPLIEHVGHLPIIATYLHRYMEKKDEIDLGEVLKMLAVHDIGETVVGDVLTYAKTEQHETSEEKAAKKLLPNYLFKYFLELEERKTLNAKFAKACDSIAPLLNEMLLPPNIVYERFTFFGFNLKNVETKKRPHHEWDPTLLKIFDYLIGLYKEIERKYSTSP